jgi:DNA-binding response OmpR family regulator
MREETTGSILVVEDQEDLARAYSSVLDEEYDVTTATSGSAALDLVDDATDVVLLDRRMPGMSGDEVVERIDSEHPSVVVAMLTAVEPGEEIVDLPLDEYVAKPIDNDELLALAETLFERAECDEQVREYFALESKKRALERSGREQTAAYERVTERLASLRAAIDADLDDLARSVNPREQDQ